MSKEFLEKKIEQMTTLLRDLQGLLDRPFEDFWNNSIVIRAAERNFQLIVDLALDINIHLLVERNKQVPETYRQSFNDLAKEKILSGHLAHELAESARLRNILVHEYDFEEDYKLFYESAKRFVPAYGEYVRVMQRTISGMEK